MGWRTHEGRLASVAMFLELEDLADAVHYVLRQPDRAWPQELVLWSH